MNRIRLVTGDTRPQVKATVLDEATLLPISLVGCTAVLKFRRMNATALQATLTGTLVSGFEQSDGTVISTAPYDVAGAGGGVVFVWGATDLDCEPGDYEGEVEVTFGDGTVQTVFAPIRFDVREEF